MNFRKLIGLTVLLAILGAANMANALEPQWFGAVNATDLIHSRNWFDPNNWKFADPVAGYPTVNDSAKINYVWKNEGPIISTPGAIANEIKVSEDRDLTTIGNQTLTVTTGGTLTSNMQVILGYFGADGRAGLPANEGTFVMNGGTANLKSHLFVGFMGTGHLIANGGELNIGAQLGLGFSAGTGTINLNGGVVNSEEFTFDALGSTTSMNINGGTWVQNHFWQNEIQAFVDSGKIKAYGGKGTVNVAWDSITQRTIVTAPSLWDPCMVAVTNASVQIHPVSGMFERGLTQDNNDTIFADAPAGTVSFVEWTSTSPVRVHTFDVHFQCDGGSNNRATSHFALKAKSPGSSTYDLTLYNADVAVPYPVTNNTRDIVITLPSPVIAQYFRAEFTAATATGPRVRELNGTGEVGSHLWNYEKIRLVSNSPVNGDPNFALKNIFQSGTNTKPTIFTEQPANTKYFVNWKMPSAENVLTLIVKATRDSIPPYYRAIKHFKLMANSVDGSTAFERVLYDTNVDGNDPNWANGKVIALAKPAVAREFRAEFTGSDPNGPRIWQLDALGFDNASASGDLNGTYTVDFKDFAALAANFGTSAAQSVIQNFEVSSLPLTTPENSTPAAGTWSVGCGHLNYPDTLFSPLPTLTLQASGAHGGTKAMKWTYNTADTYSTDYTYNSATYALSAPCNLSSYRQLTVWVKRDPANVAESRFDVRFLKNGAIMAYSNAILGSTADANGLWTQVPVPMSALNTDGRTIDMLTGIDTIQLFVDKAAGLSGHQGTIYVDDISFTPALAGDLNGDGKVDMLDVYVLSQNWLSGK